MIKNRRSKSNVFILQSNANVELDVSNYKAKYEQEVVAHKDTIAKFTADKKHILMSTEEANIEAIKEVQSRLDQERRDRQLLETRLLDATKSKNELSVDLSQLQQQVDAARAELAMEKDKVGKHTSTQLV